MTRRTKILDKIAEERGIALEVLVPQTVQQEGSIFKAAVKLGVSPNSIQYWMKKNGYTLKTQQVATLQKESNHAAK